MASDSLQTAFTAGNIAEADLIRGLLVANGIPAVIQNESAVSMLDGMVTGNRGVPVLVNAEQLAEAQRVIADSHTPTTDEEADEEE
jgi:hypothetical protein